MRRTLSAEGFGSSNGSLAAPSFVEVNGVTYCFYTGTPTENTASGYQIFLATAPLTMAQLVATNEGQIKRAWDLWCQQEEGLI